MTKQYKGFPLMVAEMNYDVFSKRSRHRLSKEIAVELLEEMGDNAHFHCVEKLVNGTEHIELWRDVLTYLDELKTEGNENESD